jgi:hypothetical protein
MKKKTKAKLYAKVYKGKVYTGYNKDLLNELILSLKLKNI